MQYKFSVHVQVLCHFTLHHEAAYNLFLCHVAATNGVIHNDSDQSCTLLMLHSRLQSMSIT